MRKRWNEQHKGVSRAGTVAILEQGEWVDRKFSQRDMQFAELQSVSREIIREAFAMSKTMLGATEGVNRATAEASEYVFSKYGLVPRLDRFKGALNNDYLKLFQGTGEGVEFDYDNPIPEDEQAESAEQTSNVNCATALIAAGFDPEETLAAFELPPITFIGRSNSGPLSTQDGAPGSPAA